MKYLQTNKQLEVFKNLDRLTFVTKITYNVRRQYFNQLHIENYKKFTPACLLF
jgi:hypothetical protein